jgi:hypothetical protein
MQKQLKADAAKLKKAKAVRKLPIGRAAITLVGL